MKNELKLYVALPLFILATCIMWGMSLSLVYIFIIAFDASNYEWWIALILIYGMSTHFYKIQAFFERIDI